MTEWISIPICAHVYAETVHNVHGQLRAQLLKLTCTYLTVCILRPDDCVHFWFNLRVSVSLACML